MKQEEIVYQRVFELSVKVLHLTQTFPVEEKYSLTDQIRRSSRSIGANIAESWPKRLYPKSFVSKLIDAQAEATKTRQVCKTQKQHALRIAVSKTVIYYCHVNRKPVPTPRDFNL